MVAESSLNYENESLYQLNVSNQYIYQYIYIRYTTLPGGLLLETLPVNDDGEGQITHACGVLRVEERKKDRSGGSGKG